MSRPGDALGIPVSRYPHVPTLVGNRSPKSDPEHHHELHTGPRAAPNPFAVRTARAPSVFYLYRLSLCRHVAKIYWFRAQFHCLFWGQEDGKQANYPWRGLSGSSPRVGPRRRVPGCSGHSSPWEVREQRPGAQTKMTFMLKRPRADGSTGGHGGPHRDPPFTGTGVSAAPEPPP